MPLVFTKEISSATKIGVWHITEDEKFFTERVSIQKIISHPHKRLQHLAGRYLLNILYPDFPLAFIEISLPGKPFLEDETFHFSISHCGDYAAVIISKLNRVGVDIEIPHPKIDRVKHKFLRVIEEQILTENITPYEHALTVGWSIKEAIFKWYGLGNVDFKKHINITQIRKEGEHFKATSIFNKEENVLLKVDIMVVGDNVLCWVMT